MSRLYTGVGTAPKEAKVGCRRRSWSRRSAPPRKESTPTEGPEAPRDRATWGSNPGAMDFTEAGAAARTKTFSIGSIGKSTEKGVTPAAL